MPNAQIKEKTSQLLDMSIFNFQITLFTISHFSILIRTQY
jgi:hypothetical protein